MSNLIPNQNKKSKSQKNRPQNLIPYNFLSQIIEDQEIQQAKNTQQATNDGYTMRRNMILIIILCLTVYLLYGLFQEFMDTIVLAFLSGVAYLHARDKFVTFLLDSDQKSKKKPLGSFIFEIISLTIVGFFIPFIRYLCEQQKGYNLMEQFSLDDIILSNQKSKNITIHVIRIIILVILYLIVDQFIDFNKLKLNSKNQRIKKLMKFIFGILIFLSILAMFIAVPLIVTKEGIKIGRYAAEGIETVFKCEIFPQIDSTSQSNLTSNLSLPLCSEYLPVNNTEILNKFMPQNKTALRQCINKTQKWQMDYIGYDIVPYEEYYCSVKLTMNLDVLRHTDFLFNMFTSIFGNFASLLLWISNFLFSITTFIAIYSVTVSSFQLKENELLSMFGRGKKELVNQITNLIEATLFITVEHLLASIALFQIFHFSDINFLLSLMLSFFAFVPIIQPYFFMIFFTIVKIMMTDTFFSPIFCCIIYYFISGAIYKLHYRNINFHHVIVSLSVLFGIYSFGVTGIIYGPCIIMVFQSVSTATFEKGFMRNSKKK